MISRSFRDKVGHRVGHTLHLARRFFGSLSNARPGPTDDGWVRSHLLPGELLLWDQMSPADQRHSIGVARAVSVELPGAERAVIAAAILHDVGKIVCGYGAFARAFATVFWGLFRAGRRGALANRWASGLGLGRVWIFESLGEYRTHPELGRQLLDEAGADPLTAAWAAEHHTPPDRWTVSVEVGAVLKDCDDD